MRSPEGHHPRLLSFFEIKDLLYEADLNIVDQQFFCFSQCMPQFDRWLQKFFPLWGYAYCVEAVKMPPMSTPTASFELAFPQPHNTPA
jgi:hypothetical protein